MLLFIYLFIYIFFIFSFIFMFIGRGIAVLLKILVKGAFDYKCKCSCTLSLIPIAFTHLRMNLLPLCLHPSILFICCSAVTGCDRAEERSLVVCESGGSSAQSLPLAAKSSTFPVFIAVGRSQETAVVTELKAHVAVGICLELSSSSFFHGNTTMTTHKYEPELIVAIV